MFIDIHVHAYRKPVPFVTPFSTLDLLLKWRDTKKISVPVFNKIARENAIKLFGLE